MVFLLLKGFEILPASVPGNFELDLMKASKIEDLYFSTNTLNAQRLEDVHVWYGSNASGKGIQASIRVYLSTNLSSSFATDYTVKIEGHCGESYFIKKDRLWHNTHPLGFTIDNCKLWWPKNAGEPSLYDTTVTLLKKGEICDIYHLKAGVRTVELDLTDSTDKDGNGEFCFKVNGKKIFVLGTNWVPLDAFHSNDSNRLPQALSLVTMLLLPFGQVITNAIRHTAGVVLNVIPTATDFRRHRRLLLCKKACLPLYQAFPGACLPDV